MDIYDQLPDDIQTHIRRMIFDEKHLLVRLLLRQKMMHVSSIGDIVLFRNAIRSLGVIDEVTDDAARDGHDRWYQYCEWEVMENGNHMFTAFEKLEATLSLVCHRRVGCILEYGTCRYGHSDE